MAEAVLAENPDGAWLAELAQLVEPALVPQAVASALGAREEPHLALRDTHIASLRHRALASWCWTTASTLYGFAPTWPRRCCATALNCESSPQPRATGGRRRACPARVATRGARCQPLNSRIGAASRSVRLFVKRATAVHPVFALTAGNCAAVAHICRRLDGLPLPLAAAQTRVLAPEQIAARLADRFRLLTNPSHAAPPRQNTLRTAIDWSYHLLDAAERKLFAGLTVFAGGCDVDGAEAICSGDGVEAADVLPVLTRLVDKSLVLPSPASIL